MKSHFADCPGHTRNLSCASKNAVKESLFDSKGLHYHARKIILGEASWDILHYFTRQQKEFIDPFIHEYDKTIIKNIGKTFILSSRVITGGAKTWKQTGRQE